MTGVTVGIDIGTTAVKALAVDPGGRPVARVRLPHRLVTAAVDRLEHDPVEAWVEGPRAALDALASQLPPGAVTGVAVAALTPSLTAVDRSGGPLGPGVLYDDVRGRAAGGPPRRGDAGDPMTSTEAAALLGWATHHQPGAAGYWSAQAVANHALGGRAVVDYATAASAGSLFDGAGWDAHRCVAAGATPDQLPEVAMFGEAIGTVAMPDGEEAVLAAGGVDAFCEQLVAGAGTSGEVLLVCGSTLVVWCLRDGWPAVSGLWTLPALQGGGAVVGGASNAGGLWLGWVDRCIAPADRAPDPEAVPLWWPYIRGERTPLHDPGRRAVLAGAGITAGPAELRRAAREASAFAARHILDLAGADPSRVVVTGGGVRDRSWLQALADGLGRRVTPVAVPEGAALGAAWLARMAIGEEQSIEGAARWARHDPPVDPDPGFAAATAKRYAHYRAAISDDGGLHVR